jgi:hypothetical protein
MTRSFPRTVRHDVLGQEFAAGSTITRQSEKSEPEAPTAARVRPGRKIAPAAGA